MLAGKASTGWQAIRRQAWIGARLTIGGGAGKQEIIVDRDCQVCFKETGLVDDGLNLILKGIGDQFEIENRPC